MNFQCPFCQAIVCIDNSDLGADVQCGQCGEVTTAPASRVSSGVVIGNDFIILEEIGRGGMGIVYLAHQISLERPAALKILSPKYANNSEFIVSFIKEARAAAKLNHPHIVQAYAVGEEDGIYFFAMENIDGETMKAVLKRETLIPIDKALVIIQQIAEALDYAWKEQKLIHRDIKPDNIMITKSGRAKLADLGLARVAGEIEDSEKDEVMGTPQYISPEHLTGSPMDARSDIYSLGATFYHFITGRFPFTGSTAVEIARKHVEEPLESPRKVNPAIPESVAQIIIKMMQKSPDGRYQTPEELVEDLRLVRRGKTPAGAYTKATGKHTIFRKQTQTIRTPNVTGGTHTTTGPIRITTTTSKPLSTTTGSVKTTSAQVRTTSGEMSPDEKAKRQVIMLGLAVLLVIVAAAGFAAWKISRDRAKAAQKEALNKKPPEQSPAKVPGKGQPGEAPVPAPDPLVDIKKKVAQDVDSLQGQSDFVKQVKEILKAASATKAAGPEILAKCDDLLRNNYVPADEPESVALAMLNKVYVPLDEERMRPARADAAVKAAELAKKKEEDARKERESEEVRRKFEADKKREEERLAEIQRQKKEAEEREQKRLEDYRKELAMRKESAVYQAMLESSKGSYDEAKSRFEGFKGEEAKVLDSQKNDAKACELWAEKISGKLTAAQRFMEGLRDSGSLLSGTGAEITVLEKNKYTGQVEKRAVYGTISEIKGGEIYLKDGAGQTVKSIQIMELPPAQLKKIIKKTASELKQEQGAFDYLMFSGEFELAKEFCIEDGDKQFISDLAYAFFKQKLAGAAGDKGEMKKLRAKYGKLEEFKKALQDASAAQPQP